VGGGSFIACKLFVYISFEHKKNLHYFGDV